MVQVKQIQEMGAYVKLVRLHCLSATRCHHSELIHVSPPLTRSSSTTTSRA